MQEMLESYRQQLNEAIDMLESPKILQEVLNEMGKTFSGF